MKRAILAAVLAVAFMMGGCSKASKDDCQKAADNLTEKGGLIGKVMAETLMKEGGENVCEGRFTPSQAKCLAELEEINEKTLTACD